MLCTCTTTRSLRSRSSRTSTKPVTCTLPAGICRTGCAMRAVLSVAVAKPAAMAAKPSASGKPSGRRRATNATTTPATTSAVAAHQAGSRSAREIADDAEAESDRQPRHQAGRARLQPAPIPTTAFAAGLRRLPHRPAAAVRRGGARRRSCRPGLGPRPALLGSCHGIPRQRACAWGYATAASGCG